MAEEGKANGIQKPQAAEEHSSYEYYYEEVEESGEDEEEEKKGNVESENINVYLDNFINPSHGLEVD